MKKLIKYRKIVKILIVFTILFIIANAVMLTLRGVAAAGVNYVTQSSSIKSPDAMNFLIVGTDLGGNRTFVDDGVRTDVQMMISFDPSNERGNAEINVMNIPRDVTATYVPSDSSKDLYCGGSGKINGGADSAARLALNSGASQEEAKNAAIDCTIGTVENMFSTTIDYYIAVNFDSFITIVDGIGGVDVVNQYEFCEQDENGKADAYCFKEGEIHLDGGQALSFARQRHESSDYERGQRQQLIMSKVAMKVLSNPTKYADTFAKVLMSDTDNNLSLDMIMSMINWASQTYNNTLRAVSNGRPFYIDIRNSPFSNDTGFDITKSFDESLGLSNIGSYPIYEIYDNYEPIEESAYITRYMFTRDNMNLPTSKTTMSKKEASKSNTLEIQFISALVTEDNTETGFYSYIEPYTTGYLDEQFKSTKAGNGDLENNLDQMDTTEEFA